MTLKAAKRSAVYLLVMAALLGISAAEDTTPEPYRVDFIEEIGIDLILLDVEVYDKDGSPIRNLKKEDFTLEINGKVRMIYSVDDLCTCSDTEPDKSQAAASGEEVGTDLPIPVEPMLYILYLDFSQLKLDGRINALAEAERWIREVMQPGEKVQIIAWIDRSGLLDLTRATDDKDVLLKALRDAKNNPELIDPFPNTRPERQEDCSRCFLYCEEENSPIDKPADWAEELAKTIDYDKCNKMCEAKCRVLAREEYYNVHRSLSGLQQLLRRLEQVRGRKTILYFFQSPTLYPSRLFAGLRDVDILDLNPDIEQVGADAVLSRTSITAAYSGTDPEPDGVNVGANLADFSGGSYNRAAYLLPEVTEKAGRGCRCIYRIGVEPPPARRESLYHATVYVHDRKIPRGFRLQHLTQFDRWLRETQMVLFSPEDVTDVPVTASLHPLGLEKGRWNLMVRISVDAERLLLLPAAGGKTGSWETGALMYREPGNDPKELLATSHLTVEDQAAGALIVHERILEGIRPGEWSLGSFVRDRNAKAFGGSKTVMVLPKPEEGGLSIPVPFLSGQPWIRTGLPDLARNQKTIEETRSSEILLEPLPLPGHVVERGNGLEFRTWVCAPKKGKGDEVIRYITRDGEPIFRFETVKPPKRGTCIELVDPVDSRYLEPGEYVYHVRYMPEGFTEPLTEETAFLLE